MKAMLAPLVVVICAAVCLVARTSAAEPDKSAVTHPYPLGDRGDMWLMAGQSNMGGYALMKQETEPDPRILFFAAGNNQWVVAKDPVHNLFFRGAAFIPKGSEGAEAADGTQDWAKAVLGIGPCLFFGKHLIRNTDRPIGLIGVSSGGWMAQVWDPRRIEGGKTPPRPYLYGPMIQRVIQAGGHLALMLGIPSKQKLGNNCEGDGPWQDQSSDVCAVASDAGIVSLDQTLPGNCGLKVTDPLKQGLDGEDVGDILLGASRPRTRPLFWENRFWYYEGAGTSIINKSPLLAIRQGPWKLLMNPDGSRIELHNLPQDPSEVDNKAVENPRVVEESSKKLLAWKKSMPAGVKTIPADAGDYKYP